MGCVGRTHCAVLRGGPNRQATVFTADHAPRVLHAAMVHVVRLGDEESVLDTPAHGEFAQREDFSRIPDEYTILRFRQRLEKHRLAEQILVTVNELLSQRGVLLKTGTLVDASSRNPEMHSSKKGNQWYFGMNAHIGADAESGLVHTVQDTAATSQRPAPSCTAKSPLASVTRDTRESKSDQMPGLM